MLESKDRTFGLELEFADLVKDEVKLPSGYKYSPDETTMFNTTGKVAPVSGKIGGEINTRPLLPNWEDVKELRKVIKDCFRHGGKALWNSGFDGHLYVGDMGLEEIKKIFALGFYTSPFLFKIFNQGDWQSVEYMVPVPTIDVMNRVMSAESENKFKEVFANSSNRGYIRYAINVMAYFNHKTIEFRLFNVTNNFRETLECIKFMYKFVEYAITHDIDDYKKLDTEEKVLEAFEMTRKTPKTVQPLIFAESHRVATSSIAKAFEVPRNIAIAISKATGDEIATVNPFLFTLELKLCDSKKITIYNQSEYADVIYRICKQGLTIWYEDQFDILNKYKDETIETELSLFFIFSRIQKYNINTDYGMKEFLSYIEEIDKSIEKLKPASEEYINLFNKCTYKIGNLNDAISSNKEIVFQQEKYSKHSGVVQSLKKYSDYSSTFETKEMSYDGVLEKCKDKNLLVVSMNQFLPMKKIAQHLNCYLYSTSSDYVGYLSRKKDDIDFSFKVPPDDYRITEDSEITVREIKLSYFHILQKSFVKKVIKFSNPKMCYVIMDKDLVLGAFEFDFAKDRSYDFWLLSDFCTNNNIPKLSKFVLYVIKTKEVKSMIEKKFAMRVERAYTNVYTTMPVSMKYRGAFQKVDTDSEKGLVYEFEFGSGGNIKDAIQEYLRRIK